MPIVLSEIVEQMETVHGGAHAFLNCQTGQVVPATDDELALAEEDDDVRLPPAQQQQLALLREVLRSEKWIEIPRNDAHEDYTIMERFCVEACADEVQEELLEAIDGKGAFRRFREAIQRLGLQEEWQRFRHAVLGELAAAWLDDQGIAFSE